MIPKDLVTAQFSLPTNGRYEDGKFAVYPNSILFEAGDYPDKNYSMTAEELSASAAKPGPVFGNIEHKSFLQGRAVEVRSKFMDSDGKTLRGVCAVPLGLDELLTDDERNLSCEWNRKTKNLEGIALTVNPRVERAALMSAAFAKFTEDDDAARFTEDFAKTNPMQQLHDMAADKGAECTGTSLMSDEAKALRADLLANFMTPSQLKAMQHIHDHAAKNGASCDQYATKRNSNWYNNDSSDTTRPKPTAKDKSMTQWEKFSAGLKALFTEAGIEPDAEIETIKTGDKTKDDAGKTTDTKPDAAPFALDPKAQAVIDSMKAQLEAQKKQIEAHEAAFSTQKKETDLSANIAWLKERVTNMQLLPADFAKYEKLAKDDPASFSAIKPILETAQPIPALAGFGSVTKAEDKPANFDADPTASFNAMCETYAKENKVSYAEAIGKVSTKYPDLAGAYRAEQMARI